MKNHTSKYSMMKNAVIGGLVLASSYLPMNARAQNNSAIPAQFPKYDASTLLAAQPTEMQKITEKVGKNVEAKANASEYTGLVKNRYTSNGFYEFLWGVSRPIHAYNHNPGTGELQILPFWNPFSLDAFRAGGVFSPLEGIVATLHNQTLGRLTGKNMYNAFSDNPALTLGVAVDYALMALAAGGSSGGSSSAPANPSNPSKPDNSGDKTNPSEPNPRDDGQGGNL